MLWARKSAGREEFSNWEQIELCNFPQRFSFVISSLLCAFRGPDLFIQQQSRVLRQSSVQSITFAASGAVTKSRSGHLGWLREAQCSLGHFAKAVIASFSHGVEQTHTGVWD